MSDSQDSIGPDEFVLRRIHRNHCSRDLPRVIHFAAFRPSREDTLGLSVFRELYVSAAHVAGSGRKPGECFVAQLEKMAKNAREKKPEEDVVEETEDSELTNEELDAMLDDDWGSERRGQIWFARRAMHVSSGSWA
jgi:hypothetical protein